MHGVEMVDHRRHGGAVVNPYIIKAGELVRDRNRGFLRFSYKLGNLLDHLGIADIVHIHHNSVKIIEVRQLIDIVFTGIVVGISAPVSRTVEYVQVNLLRGLADPL